MMQRYSIPPRPLLAKDASNGAPQLFGGRRSGPPRLRKVKSGSPASHVSKTTKRGAPRFALPRPFFGLNRLAI